MARRPPTRRLAEARVRTSAEKFPPEASSEDPLRHELETRLAPLVPAQKRQEAINIAVGIVQENFSGPIAHPRHLAEYDRIVPGSAERIIRMAEKQQEHNISVRDRGLDAAIADERLGMWVGSAILSLLIIAAFSAGAFFSNNILAGILVTGAVLNVIGLYLNRKKG